MELNRLQVTIKGCVLKAPLLTASGTSGTTDELNCLRNKSSILDSLGAFVTKGVTLRPRKGNPALRVIETRTGLLNSIGLQNSGAEHFAKHELPCLLKYRLPIIVNISADSVEEFGILSAFLMENDLSETIAGIEINVSCPNLSAGGIAFGVNGRTVEKVVRSVARSLRKGVVSFTKLTPNVTDITEPAKGAIQGGTNALSMINTLRGAAINVHTGEYYLGNKTGGLSGPAVKPVGVYMVSECFRRIPECRDRSIPIVGIGGISTWEDALEYIMAGATVVGVGTAWFVNSNVFRGIKNGLEKYCDEMKCTIAERVGFVHVSGDKAVQSRSVGSRRADHIPVETKRRRRVQGSSRARKKPYSPG
jgi:dihydroorotate dehydrogenase (NAD+) catalytic subunit